MVGMPQMASIISKLPPGTPKELKAHRYIELDSLRGLAALTVVLYHFVAVWATSPWHRSVDLSPIRVLIAGHEAVVLFFVLSGFVLSVPYSGKNPPSYVEFLVKRFCRLYLPYLCAGLIAISLAARLYSSASTGNSWMDQTWSQKPTLQILRGLVLVHGHGIEQVNTAFWSIILEIHVSLIFPILYFVSRRVHPAIVAILFVALPVASSFAPTDLVPKLLAPIFTAGLFVIGILLHKNLDRISLAIDGLSSVSKTMLAIIMVVLFEVPGLIVEAAHIDGSILALGLVDYSIGIGAAGIIALSVRESKLKNVLRSRVLLRLGALSYSTYLIHGTVLFTLVRILYGKVPFGLLFPVYLLLVYIGSEIFHFAVDKNAVTLGRRAAAFFRGALRPPTPAT